LEKKLKGREKKYSVKGLCRINIRVRFFLYQTKNENERQSCIVQRHDKKMCAKDINPYPFHHRVYEIARFVDSRK
jgi:hypothetical protein